MQTKLIEIKKKECSNWTKYTDGKWLFEDQLRELKKDILDPVGRCFQ